jgi:hypothetical protein
MSGAAPKPVPQIVTYSRAVTPGSAVAKGVRSALLTELVKIPGPEPASFQVNVPKELGTTVMLGCAGTALVAPLYVTVRVPAPLGVFEGNTALIWEAETYAGYAATAVPPTVTLMETPPIVVNIG